MKNNKSIENLLAKMELVEINKHHNCDCWTGLEDTDENYYKAYIPNKDLLCAALPIIEALLKEEKGMGFNSAMTLLVYLRDLTK